MRNLQRDPAWEAHELGVPLPDTLHACSVCLPTWQSILDYEEGREKVIRSLRAGYPRFALHPIVSGLFNQAREALASEEELVYVFPSREVAQRAQRFVEKKAGGAVRVASYEGLYALVVPTEMHQTLKDYWQFTGEIVSSRLAQDVTTGNLSEEKESGRRLRGSLARSFGVMKDDLFLYESGMSAIYTMHRLLTALRPGKKTLQVEFPYTDAMKVQEHFGSGVVMLSEAIGESFGEALQRIREGEFAAVFCELPSNPLMRSVDVPSLSQACRDSGTPLLIDDTVASHHNVDVLEYADLVTTSLTKWVSGVGDVVAGSVRLNRKSPQAELLWGEFHQDSPDHCRLYERDAAVLLENIKGFRKRIRLSNEHAEAIADFLTNHSLVEKVWYPKYTDRDNYERVMREGGGYGGLISFTLKNAKKTKGFYDRLRWNKGPSLGTEFSLASPYTLLAHYHELDWAEGCGVPAHLIRLSIGVEPVETLIASLSAALEG